MTPPNLLFGGLKSNWFTKVLRTEYSFQLWINEGLLLVHIILITVEYYDKLLLITHLSYSVDTESEYIFHVVHIAVSGNDGVSWLTAAI